MSPSYANACLSPLGRERIAEFVTLLERPFQPDGERFVAEVLVDAGDSMRLDWAEVIIRPLSNRFGRTHVVYFPCDADEPSDFMDALSI